MVIEHVEFKIVCDKCYTCLSDFEVNMGTKRKTVRYLEKENDIKKGIHICDDCKSD